MSLDKQIANLIRTGTLKQAARDEARVLQYVINARELRADAETAKSALGRFLLAYDALYALAMAVLSDQGVRTDGEGHRSLALQLTIGELAKGSVGGAVEAVIQIHNARNSTTYFEPIPPVSDRLAAATLKLLDAALAGAKAQLHLPAAAFENNQES